LNRKATKVIQKPTFNFERGLMNTEAIVLSALISLIVFYFAYRFGFFRLPKEKKEFNLLSLPYLLVAFLLFLGIQIAVVSFLEGLWNSLKVRHFETPSRGWISIVEIWLVAFSIFGYFRFLDSPTQGSIWNKTKKFNNLNKAKQFLFGIMTWLIAYPTVNTLDQALGLILYLSYGLPPAEQISVKVFKTTFNDPFVFSIMTLTIVFLVPIIEELMFRGLTQTYLKNYLSRTSAVAVTALIFALFHYSPEQGITNIKFIITLFVLSCFLGFIYERQGSLWAPIGLHVAFNGMSVLSLVFF
jgi:membrane protease YdiL (CAAX protease family)